jgi:hypothetical protein
MMLGIKERCEAGGTQGPRSPITREFRPYQGSLRGLRLEP